MPRALGRGERPWQNRPTGGQRQSMEWKCSRTSCGAHHDCTARAHRTPNVVHECVPSPPPPGGALTGHAVESCGGAAGVPRHQAVHQGLLRKRRIRGSQQTQHAQPHSAGGSHRRHHHAVAVSGCGGLHQRGHAAQHDLRKPVAPVARRRRGNQFGQSRRILPRRLHAGRGSADNGAQSPLHRVTTRLTGVPRVSPHVQRSRRVAWRRGRLRGRLGTNACDGQHQRRRCPPNGLRRHGCCATAAAAAWERSLHERRAQKPESAARCVWGGGGKRLAAAADAHQRSTASPDDLPTSLQ
jgi:hypothetical protein